MRARTGRGISRRLPLTARPRKQLRTAKTAISRPGSRGLVTRRRPGGDAASRAPVRYLPATAILTGTLSAAKRVFSLTTPSFARLAGLPAADQGDLAAGQHHGDLTL